jgi:AcrR family transcriptional regulator
MPKRDEKYMQTQRETIARAVLPVLVEKGYYETTSRDLCQAAGVSNGALYLHFPTREAAIVEASRLDQADRLNDAIPDSWAEYVRIAETGNMPAGYVSRRWRLSVQFAAEISQMDKNPEGLTEHYKHHRFLVERALLRLKDLGIIAMPLGVKKTAEMHQQLGVGVFYNLYSNHESDPVLIREAFREGLALTAGLIGDAGDLPLP